MGALCCPEKVNAASQQSGDRSQQVGGMSDIATLSPIEPCDPPVVPHLSYANQSSTKTRTAPGADEAEDTKRLSVLLEPDLAMFDGYAQASTDSDEESTSDLDIPRGQMPDSACKRVPKAPRASISTRPSLHDAQVKRASIVAHEEGAFGWLDSDQYDDVFGTA